MNAGIVVVVAAGNDSAPVCEQPAVEGKILCVGAVDRRGMRSFFSSGDSDSIMAPGGSATGGDEDVLSTLPGSKYGEIAGTSQAAPHVTGTAALLASRGVKGPAAIDKILSTAKDAGVPGPDPMFGVGILDANAAVAGLPATPPSGSGSGTGPSSTGKITIARSFKISTARRKGIRARCRAATTGTCRVTLSRGAKLGAGSLEVSGGRTAKVAVRLTPAGKRALRRGKSFRATAVLSAPGADTQKLKIAFRR